MAIIKTSKAHRRNLPLITIIGLIQFNENLEAEIEDDKVDELLESDDSISLVEEDFKVDTTDLDNKDDEDKDEGNQQSNDDNTSLDNQEITNSSTIENQTPNPQDITGSQVEGKKEAIDDQVVIDELNKMTVADLKALAVSQNLPEDEWKKLNKPDLVEYLAKK